MYQMGPIEIRQLIDHLRKAERIAYALDLPKTGGLNEIEWHIAQVLGSILRASTSPIQIEQQPRASADPAPVAKWEQVFVRDMPPLLSHRSHHSFSNAMIGTGPEVRIARAEHEYNMLRESMLADRRIADLVQSGTITTEEGQLTKTRNIELAWESYAALQALIADHTNPKRRPRHD